MGNLTKTTIPTIDCQELSSLVMSALDYGYTFGLDKELELCNPIEGDVYYEEIVDRLFNGQSIAFKDKSDNSYIVLTREKLLNAAFEYAQEFPKTYSRIGADDGYIPQVGLYIILVALYGWPRVATDIGQRFSRLLQYDR